MPFLIALDPGQHCGFAVGPLGGKPVMSGTWNLGDDGPHRPRRLADNLYTLDQSIEAEHGDSVRYLAIEDVASRRLHHGSKFHARFLGAVDVVCSKLGVEWMYVPATKIKKYGTGNGHASKEQMVEAATEQFPGIAVQDDNHADALLLWSFANDWWETTK